MATGSDQEQRQPDSCTITMDRLGPTAEVIFRFQPKEVMMAANPCAVAWSEGMVREKNG